MVVEEHSSCPPTQERGFCSKRTFAQCHFFFFPTCSGFALEWLVLHRMVQAEVLRDLNPQFLLCQEKTNKHFSLTSVTVPDVPSVLIFPKRLFLLLLCIYFSLLNYFTGKVTGCEKHLIVDITDEF